MSEREESESVTNENAVTKPEEIGENLGNEESPANLEAASKDKAKSKRD